MWEIINFVLLLLIILVIIFIFISAIWYYYKIKYYVDEAINHIGSLIPTFNSYEYSNINYNQDLSDDDFNTKVFNKKLAIFLCYINMSTYNIFSEFDPKLPDNIKLNHVIGNICYIYKYKVRNTKVRIFSFRGTRTGDDVITNLNSVQSELSSYSDNILVHQGFYRLWNQYKDEFKSYYKNKCSNDAPILITGHSLGCAGAIFTSLLFSNYDECNIHLYMFAPPKIGNHHLIKKLDTDVPNNYAVINVSDFIPTLPPVTFTTIGNTWLYDNFSNRFLIDYQMGSMSLNHRLDTYVCGLDDQQDFCKEPIWKKVPSLITIV